MKIKTKELRGQSIDELNAKLNEVEMQLIKEEAQAERGTSKTAGKIKSLKRTIARIKTIIKQKGG